MPASPSALDRAAPPRSTAERSSTVPRDGHAGTARRARGPRRLRLEIRGAVQGVGFRPFVYRLAHELSLAGWVVNDARGVVLEVEAGEAALRRFLHRLRGELPPRAEIHDLQASWLDAAGLAPFAIRDSPAGGAKRAVVLADVATCSACLGEIRDPADRRHGYPFTNCTDCGPRFTIVRGLPYDRPNTTMAGFELCPDCRREYEDPGERRFHAQPNACPRCGPRLTLLSPEGRTQARGDAALETAVAALRRGEILAVKGLGGFHLMVDAADAAAVAELRRRKRRPAKPLALMVPDLDAVRALCTVDAAAAELLTSPEAPIVLLPRRPGTAMAEAVSDPVAPGRPELGLMLPYTPLHHLLTARFGRPLVATSGNLSEEPIVTAEADAVERLGAIADRFLVHDRPIARHADDSVARLLDGAPQILRRARGWAPLPLRLPPLPVEAGADADAGEPPALLAVGAHLKNTVALRLGDQVFVSQHLGDMENPRSQAAFEAAVADFLELWEARPAALVHDLHPDYATTRWALAVTDGDEPSTRFARLAGLPRLAVQHHHAHLAACLAEHGLWGGGPAGEPVGDGDGPVLGFAWDGTGYGPDATVWGGEVLLGGAAACERVARLRPFRLPGGDAAVREPRRTALALLWESGAWGAAGADLATAAERKVFARILDGGFNAPWTTSAGRLFDGVAALAGLHPRVTFEGQAAMALEAAVDAAEATAYPLDLRPPATPGEPLEIDWRPLVRAVVADVARGVGAGAVAARFHAALVAAIVEVARRFEPRLAPGLPPGRTVPRVALTGGCFQNRALTERAAAELRRGGFEVLLHRRVPPNDGGIAFGQAVVAAARLARPGAADLPS